MIFSGVAASDAFWPIVLLIKMVAVIGGVFIVLNAIFKLRDYGMHGDYAQHSWMITLVMMGIGILLINSHHFIQDWNDSIFGAGLAYPNGNPLGYGGSDNALVQKWRLTYSVILGFIQLWGYFAFTRGLFVWHQTTLGYKHSSFWKGFFHCFGGMLAINFSTVGSITIDLLSSLNTF